jgi:hypothetical protein
MNLEMKSAGAMMSVINSSWKAENGSSKFHIELPDGKSIVSATLKFREIEFLKETVISSLDFDDDRKLCIHLENEDLTTNRVAELYVLLVYIGILVKGWEGDSEFTWKHPNSGTSAFFWEGDGQVFPENDFNQ